MDLSPAIVVAAFVACPLVMGAAMWLMNRRMSERTRAPRTGSAGNRLQELRSERERLEAEIAEVRQVADLEAKRAALLAPGAMAVEIRDASVAAEGAPPTQ